MSSATRPTLVNRSMRAFVICLFGQSVNWLFVNEGAPLSRRKSAVLVRAVRRGLGG
jgi:hypothetical protein